MAEKIKKIVADAWANLLQNRNAPDAQQCYGELVGYYSAKGRHYHNLRHLAELFGWLQSDGLGIKDWQAVVAAVFYHDAIYNPLRGDNEARSAKLAWGRLEKLGFGRAFRQKVCAWIEATQTHRASPEAAKDSDCLHFLDADLAILGAAPEKYEQYRQAVRREYAIFPDFMYRKGRKKVLLQLLQSPKLYASPFFAGRLEQQARANMGRELESL